MKIRCYVSHSIRGKYGVNATEEQMVTNNDKAKEFVKQLRTTFPTIDFYVPGEHDEFVMLSYQNKFLSEEQILKIDCDILQRCNFMVMLVPEYFWSRGMCIERDYAMNASIPHIDNLGSCLTKRTIDMINHFLESLMR